MPNEGLSSHVWQERMFMFAAGTFKFGKGMHPGAKSKWAQKIKAIKACPRHNTQKGQKRLDGKKAGQVKCECGYHTRKSTTPEKVCILCFVNLVLCKS